MKEITVLRIYMPIAAKFSGPRTFWEKLFGPSLGGLLLKRAKEFGIEQAIFQRVLGGYLGNGNLVFEQVETVSPDLPQCVELIDREDLIKKFMETYKDQFRCCRILLFKAVVLKEVENECLS